MAGWSLVLVDAKTGDPVRDLTPVGRDFQLKFKLRGPAEVSWSMDGLAPAAADVAELLTDVVVSYNGDVLTRCRVTQSADEIGVDGHAVTFSAVDYRGMLARRYLRDAQSLSGDLTNVAWQLINWTQVTNPAGNGDWGITKGLTATTATVTSRQIAAGKKIVEAIDELAMSYPGFDWEIDGDLKFNVWAFRGEQRDFAFEWGGNVIGVHRDADSSKYGNHVRYSGANGVTPTYLSVGGMTSRPEGRIEQQEGNTDLATTTAVGLAAQAWLQRHGSFFPGYQFTLAPDRWDPSLLWLGDLAPVSVRSGRLDVVSIERVESIDVTLADTGVSSVQVGFGELRESLAQLVRSPAARLETLFRR